MLNYLYLNNAQAGEVFTETPGATLTPYGVEVSAPNGFMVGVPSKFSVVLELSKLATGRRANKTDYADAMQSIAKAVALLNQVTGTNDYFVGAWLDSKGLLYLDIAQYVEDVETAERLCIERGEQELFNWETMTAYNPRNKGE